MKLCAILFFIAVIGSSVVGVAGQFPTAESAFAGGRHIQASYSACGVWNSNKTEKGYQLDSCCRVDASYPGNPWQSLCFRYTNPDGHTDEQVFIGNQGESNHSTNGEPTYYETPRCDWTVDSVEVFPPGAGSSFVGVKHYLQVGELRVLKIESWDFKAKSAVISFSVEFPEQCCGFLENVTQDGPLALEDVSITFSVDTDVDYENFGTFDTINWRVYGDWYAESVGPASCTTLAFGKCLNDSVVGHSDWLNCPEEDEIQNNNGTMEDKTMAWQHTFDKIYCGETKAVSFVVAWGSHPAYARAAFEEAFSCYCPFSADSPPDFDDAPEDLWPLECACQCSNSTEEYCDCADNSPHTAPPTAAPTEMSVNATDAPTMASNMTGNATDTPTMASNMTATDAPTMAPNGTVPTMAANSTTNSTVTDAPTDAPVAPVAPTDAPVAPVAKKRSVVTAQDCTETSTSLECLSLAVEMAIFEGNVERARELLDDPRISDHSALISILTSFVHNN